MLVLTRRLGEEIVIDGNIRITVVSVKGDRVRIGIEAPPTVLIDRQEIHERRQHSPHCVPHPCLVLESSSLDRDVPASSRR
ncbi:MAG: carbon storage regulator [Gemmataceae bacterium]